MNKNTKDNIIIAIGILFIVIYAISSITYDISKGNNEVCSCGATEYCVGN